jgi:hypothetical protein
MSGAGTADPDRGIDVKYSANKDKRDYSVDDAAMQMFECGIMDDGWTETVERDLEEMNRGKFGRPFVCSDSAIEWGMMYRAAAGTNYRRTVGAVNRLLRKNGHPEISLTQFYDRAQSLAGSRMHASDPDDERVLGYGTGEVVPEGDVVAAMDSTGESLGSHGGWMEYFWNMEKRTGWIKVHVITDTDTNEVLSYVITDESCGDISCADRLIGLAQGAGHRLKKLLGDASYDKIDLWNLCKRNGTEYCANIKSPQLGKHSGGYVRTNGCPQRAAHIRKILKVGRDKWKEDVGYGRRWKVECAFSDLKRMFGDVMRARTRHRMAAEIYWIIRCHNLYKCIRKVVTGERTNVG